MLARLSRSESLWLPVAAPIAWSLHFSVCYVLIAVWCGRFALPGTTVTTWLVIGTVVTAVGISVMAIAGWRKYRRSDDSRHARDGRTPIELDSDSLHARRRFVGFTTMTLAGLSLLGMAFNVVGVLLVGGCAS